VAGAAAIAAWLTGSIRFLTAGMAPLVALAVCGVWFGILYLMAIVGFGVVTAEERRLVADVLLRGTGRSWLRLPEAAPAVRE
jgi:hypothetical protein